MTQAAPHDTDKTPVASAAIALLDQCAGLLARLPEGAYQAESRVIEGGTIGKHVRHCLDHYRAAIEGLQTGQTVAYDHRARGGDIETEPGAALREIDSLRARLSLITAAQLAEPMSVRFMLTGDGVESEFQTSFGREIAFAGHHAVHHFAMVGAIAAEHGASPPDGFGKAPSTINFESSRD